MAHGRKDTYKAVYYGSAKTEDSTRRNMEEAKRMVKVLLVGLAAIGIMAMTAGCNNDPVKSAENVVACYNETGMGTSCLYHEVTSK